MTLAELAATCPQQTISAPKSYPTWEIAISRSDGRFEPPYVVRVELSPTLATASSMQATDGDRVVELPEEVVLEVARAYARKVARNPLRLLVRGPWVLRALLGRQADTPFNQKRSRRHDLQRRGEGVLEDGYQFRVIAELFHAERTSHHKTWHSVFVALREELAGLFENIVKVDEASGDTAANRRSNLNRSLGRLIGGLPFSFQLLHVVAFGDFPMLLHLLWVRGGMPLMNAVGAKGETPLCVTVIKNQTGSADRLLRLGAHVDGPRALGLSTYTPLMWAARCGHVDVAKVLLRHNASAARCPYFANNLPSDVAVHYKHFGLALVLKRYESEQERRLADGADA